MCSKMIFDHWCEINMTNLDKNDGLLSSGNVWRNEEMNEWIAFWSDLQKKVIQFSYRHDHNKKREKEKAPKCTKCFLNKKTPLICNFFNIVAEYSMLSTTFSYPTKASNYGNNKIFLLKITILYYFKKRKNLLNYCHSKTRKKVILHENVKS